MRNVAFGILSCSEVEYLGEWAIWPTSVQVQVEHWSQVWVRSGVGHGLRAPSRDKIELVRLVAQSHRPSGEMLCKMQGYEGRKTWYALNLLALTFVRPDLVAKAEWRQFDLDGARCVIRVVKAETKFEAVKET